MLNGPTEWCSFARFDIQGKAEIAVTVNRPFSTVQILPSSADLEAETSESTIRFSINQPKHLTVCLDGNDRHPLHLFIRGIETDMPDPSDPNVLYFGPGEHWVNSIKIRSGQTVYIDGAAVLRAVLPEAPGTRATPGQQLRPHRGR